MPFRVPPLELRRRPAPSRLMQTLSPLLATAITLLITTLIFTAIGQEPGEALYIFFLEPLTEAWMLEEVLVKATPLALIAIGLCICYRANVWNIGAEGQLVIGATLAASIPILLPEWQSPLTLPIMLALGCLGGAAYGLIPATLRVRFGASEILTSLMLVYVAELLLDYLVRGPWRDPGGFNFPQSLLFHEYAKMPILGADRLNIGLLFAIAAGIAAAIFLTRTLRGFSLTIAGEAPRAARFAGVSRDRLTLGVFAFSGAMAGLAGAIEVAGPIGRLQPEISPGYGFTAIIVAFLGRLNPIGALIAAFILSLTYIGGESAQLMLGVSDKMTRVIQGLLLVTVLGCDALIHHRLSWRASLRPTPKAAPAAAPQESRA